MFWKSCYFKFVCFNKSSNYDDDKILFKKYHVYHAINWFCKSKFQTIDIICFWKKTYNLTFAIVVVLNNAFVDENHTTSIIYDEMNVFDDECKSIVDVQKIEKKKLNITRRQLYSIFIKILRMIWTKFEIFKWRFNSLKFIWRFFVEKIIKTKNCWRNKSIMMRKQSR